MSFRICKITEIENASKFGVRNRRCPSLFAPAPGRRNVPAVRRRRNSPARQRRIAYATRLHHVKGAGKWAAARQRRIAYATRLHQKTDTEERVAAQLRRSAHAPRVHQRTVAEKKEKPLTFVSGSMVEVTGLEPVTLCRLVHDEPGCNT